VIQSTDQGVILTVRVIPRARRAELAGIRDDALLIRLTAPPVEGAANAELIELVSEAFAIPKRSITIVTGDRARVKRVRLAGIDAATVRSRLEMLARS
jgi:uncharacterized protein